MDAAGAVESAPAPGPPLLAAKQTVPRVRTRLLDRARLLDLVSHGTEGPLTLVTGAAGTGKTSLLASWIAGGAAPGPVAWLTLDPQDDEPGTFWAYVVAALRRAGVSPPEDIGEPMQAQTLDRSFLVRLADCVATWPRPVVLVLDQFDVLTHPQVLRGIDFLLSNTGGTMRLVLLCRGASHLPLHRYELNGELTRIGNAELAFTPEEAEALLRQHGVRLSARNLAALVRHVGGWAAALRLCAVAMQRRPVPDDFVTALPDADAALAGYLVDEVLDIQSAEVRDFLLRTSLVDSLCPDLADALTGRRDGRLVLEGLQTGNVLTEALEGAPGWYRYHPLFASVLRAELAKRHPELVGELYRRASDWFERAGLTADAVEAAAAALDWPRAAAAVVRGLGIGTLLAGREAGRLGEALDRMPATQPGSMPAIVRAARAMTRFDLGTCRSQLAVAERHGADAGADAGADGAALRASAAVVRAVLARIDGDVEAAESAQQEGERQLAGVAGSADRRAQMLALLLSSVGTAQLWAGRFPEAERTLRRGLVAAAGQDCEYPRLNILGRLAGIEFRNGRLRRAAQLGQDALSLAEASGLPVDQRTGAGHVTLAMVALEWNDRAAARRHLADAQKTVGARHDPFVATIVPLLRAWLYAGVRDFRRAFAALEQVPRSVGGRPLPPWLVTRVRLTEAAIHLKRGDTAATAEALDAVPQRGTQWTVAKAALAVAAGDPRAAVELLEPVLDGELPDVGASRVEAWLLMARLRLAVSDVPAAGEALARALVLARPEGHRRAFADAGPWLKELLRRCPQVAAAHRWLGPPLVERAPAQFPVDGEAPPAAVVERLTDRERTVLQRMAEAMSTEDIAQDLYLSVNTIKTHQKSIYRKLAVSRRNEAVRKARALRLI